MEFFNDLQDVIFLINMSSEILENMFCKLFNKDYSMLYD